MCYRKIEDTTNYTETYPWIRDKYWVQFAEQAQSLLDAALAALARGESCQEMTVLIGRDGGIQMCADSDWPLDSLMLDRGARRGYRVSPRRGSVRVEGREGLRRCLLETALSGPRRVGHAPQAGLTRLISARSGCGPERTTRT